MRSVAAKRLLDAVLAAAVLLVLAPLLLLIALAVKLDSPGSIFFTQERVGRGGRPFKLIKFRTMVADAPAMGPNVSATGDPRLTRIGRVLRRSFIDEAPQLLNVLKGDMSIVGPRPETPEYVQLLSAQERRILAVRPGMAGASTLAYSREEPAILARQADPDAYYRSHLLHERVAADLAYIDHATLLTDVGVLAQTAVFVFSGLLGAALRQASSDEAPASADEAAARLP